MAPTSGCGSRCHLDPRLHSCDVSPFGFPATIRVRGPTWISGCPDGAGTPGGAATIDQQLAKALYVPDDQSVIAELRIAAVAVRFEWRYGKPQILELYLNAIYLGHGAWGVAQASETYFGKPADQLDWAEANLLAGLPEAPSTYDPLANFALARARQRAVLDALVQTGVLSTAHADAAYGELTALDR